jgi:GNAT superfamily N-acetyltransferase
MESGLLAEYIGAFEQRSRQMMGTGDRVIRADGVTGTLAASSGVPRGRLLVTDDRALDVLRQKLPDLPAWVVSTLGAATECRNLLLAEPAFRGEEATAMVCRDLATVPAPDLPAGLTVRGVRRGAQDEPDGVPIDRAAAACLRSEPDVDESLERFVAYLCSLPPAARLFAATDADGEVRATAASGCFGQDANAFFVSTDQAWRGRGVGTAMTAYALRDAASRGAVRACLEATAAGRGIYERLGFVAVSPVTMFLRVG